MFDLDGFIETCRGLAGDPHAGRKVLETMRAAVADPAAVAEAMSPLGSNPDPLAAPLFRSPELTVLNVALRPGTVSIGHDHSIWAVIGIFQGEEANTFYRRTDHGLEEAGRRTIHTGEAILLGPDVIHAIENPLEGPTLGLHVYGGDLLGAQRRMWDPQGAEERVYNIAQFNRWSRDLAQSRRASRLEAPAG
jgi:predicted metal-dependent enzyme (double-stranded beta helix superfamily)